MDWISLSGCLSPKPIACAGQLKLPATPWLLTHSNWPQLLVTEWSRNCQLDIPRAALHSFPISRSTPAGTSTPCSACPTENAPGFELMGSEWFCRSFGFWRLCLAPCYLQFGFHPRQAGPPCGDSYFGQGCNWTSIFIIQFRLFCLSHCFSHTRWTPEKVWRRWKEKQGLQKGGNKWQHPKDENLLEHCSKTMRVTCVAMSLDKLEPERAHGYTFTQHGSCFW